MAAAQDPNWRMLAGEIHFAEVFGMAFDSEHTRRSDDSERDLNHPVDPPRPSIIRTATTIIVAVAVALAPIAAALAGRRKKS